MNKLQQQILFGDATLYDVFVAFIIIVLGFFLIRLICGHVRKRLKDKLTYDHVGTLIKSIQYTAYIILIFSVLPILHINLSALLVTGGIIGIAVGFASQNIISNLISGLILVIEKPFKIGDSIKIADVSGVIESIDIMSTTLRTFEGLFVRIPNQQMFTSNITNFVGHIARRFDFIIGIRYSDDAKQAIQIARDVIDKEPLALNYPEPNVFVDNFGDSSVNIIVRIWSISTEWYELKREIVLKVKKHFESHGIEVPFPQRTLWYANTLDSQDLNKENINTDTKEKNVY